MISHRTHLIAVGRRGKRTQKPHIRKEQLKTDGVKETHREEQQQTQEKRKKTHPEIDKRFE